MKLVFFVVERRMVACLGAFKCCRGEACMSVVHAW